MPYYHVRIAKKSGKTRWAFAFDLTKKQVVEEIITPFTHREPFMCARSPIEPSDVDHIRINETEESSSQIIAKTKWKRFGEKLMDLLAGESKDYLDEWYIIHAGKDVTRDLIKGFSLSREVSRTFVTKEHVFIVHGRDDEQALLLQKYLKDKLKVEAVMFDDLPDKGRTIIEQLINIQDNVGYAFVIVTPDDVGCSAKDIIEAGMLVAGLKSVKGETVGKIFEMFHTRARQNVVFEFGLFIGALGRERVCCLLKKDTEERPSDIDGILYKPFNKSVSEIFHEIPEELAEAGFEIKM